MRKFIVFEGIDGVGKSTLSKAVAQKINAVWTKEPTFTSEQADQLNLKSKDSIEREVEFCIDRINHQSFISTSLKDVNLVCDRYIWSGLAYSSVFNPSAFAFAKAMYQHKFFIKPDYYVLVEAPIDVCLARRKLTDDMRTKLIELRKAYLDTGSLVKNDSTIIIVANNGPIKNTVDEILTKIKI